MIKGFITAAVLMFSMNTLAAQNIFDTTLKVQQDMLSRAISRGLDWKVGDTNNYKLDMGFLKGTMVMTVASVGAEGIWMNQNMDLGGAGKQKVETLINPSTGEVIKTIVNGKEQEMPKQEIEIIEMVDDNITVPAGTFQCVHARINDKTNNQEINVWMAASVPLSGMIKTIQPSQFGNVTVELTSFKKM